MIVRFASLCLCNNTSHFGDVERDAAVVSYLCADFFVMESKTVLKGTSVHFEVSIDDSDIELSVGGEKAMFKNNWPAATKK